MTASKLLSALAFCVLQVLTATAVAAPTISPQELESELVVAIEKVPELRFLRTEAEKAGVEAHLFGGTAASFAHYVKADLLRRKGVNEYQESRFDYDFTSIFRSTQDLDVVVDAPRAVIDRLTEIMRQRFPHFIGDKGMKWELRSLREPHGTPGSIGYKEALLNSPDFLLQNTDSHSTGLIRVTVPSRGQIVRDLRDWNSRPSKFEIDLIEGKLHYYAGADHYRSPRALAGENPEIFSVVRALTKAFQYDLIVDPGTLKVFSEIIERTDWKQFEDETSVRRRFLDMSKKILLHAVDIERAWETIEALGLRARLEKFDDVKEADSLARLMGREPLKSFEVGKGDGRTAADIARELGMKDLVVSHETSSFLAYESIMRSRLGEPNFYVSRPGHLGEMALYGWGTYTKIGRQGAAGSGITVRMTIDPRAREGTDFIFVPDADYVVLRNKSAARTIDEPIRMTFVEYVKWIASSDGRELEDDRALQETFRRKIKHNPGEMSATDAKVIRRLVTRSARRIFVMNELHGLGLDHMFSLDDLIAAMKDKSFHLQNFDLIFERIQKLPVSEQSKALEVVKAKFQPRSLSDWSEFVEYIMKWDFDSSISKSDLQLAELGQHIIQARSGRVYLDGGDTYNARVLREAFKWVRAPGLLRDLLWGFASCFESTRMRPPDRELLRQAANLYAESHPKLEEIEVLKMFFTEQGLNPYREIVWEAFLNNAKTAKDFMLILAPRAKTLNDERRGGKIRFDFGGYFELASGLWERHMDRFLALNPSREELGIAKDYLASRPDLVNRLSEVRPRSCPALFTR